MIEISQKIITAGMIFGDECKGKTVDLLVRMFGAATVVRYDGGPNAAHNVMTPEGWYHCYSQLGSGSFLPEVKTYLSEEVLIEPFNLIRENRALIRAGAKDAMDRIKISPQCRIITPYHRYVGQMREIARGNNRHGSVGMGIGETVADEKTYRNFIIKVADLLDPKKLRYKLNFWAALKIDHAQQILDKDPKNGELKIIMEKLNNHSTSALAAAYLGFARKYGRVIDREDLYRQSLDNQTIVFEGAQGVLLDKRYGFFPHITKSDTTMRNAERLLEEMACQYDLLRFGIMRAYFTRHGAGPLVTEDGFLTSYAPEDHNPTGVWQGKFRCGWFDLLLARYAIAANKGIDKIALTCLDKLSGLDEVKVCVSYRYTGSNFQSLDKYFQWEMTPDKKIKITGINLKEGDDKTDHLTKLLFDCQPWDQVIFPGWKKLGRGEFEDLPDSLKEYVGFLESKQGLDTPISIISIGPTWADTIMKYEQPLLNKWKASGAVSYSG